MELRDLPSVDELARGVDDPLAIAAARTVLDRAREEIRAGADPGDLGARVRDELTAARAPSLRRVLNATGVIVHTNLGRAPLAEEALAQVVEAARGYSNLELDLREGSRGSRQDHVAPILRRLTGAEAALVVNNNAAAMLLALAALAEDREVIVSRGELIEIGDGFRIPDVLAHSGARLVEVGSTNRTRARDYEKAVRAETALILRVHQSNFRVVGFTELPRIEELAAVARRAGVPLLDDLGSGVLASNSLLQADGEPSARDSLAAGADLVCFSGDKLLGGPQAGILVGRAAEISCAARHPLARAFRIDKLSLAALEATLALYRDPGLAAREVPVLAMLLTSREELERRARLMAEQAGGKLVESSSRVGGGALPLMHLYGPAVAVEPGTLGADGLAAALRRHDPPVIVRVKDGRILLDPRTLSDEQARTAGAAVRGALA
jgi:L-seryl-tRNA(Ser) seleniumtransferase